MEHYKQMEAKSPLSLSFLIVLVQTCFTDDQIISTRFQASLTVHNKVLLVSSSGFGRDLVCLGLAFAFKRTVISAGGWKRYQHDGGDMKPTIEISAPSPPDHLGYIKPVKCVGCAAVFIFLRPLFHPTDIISNTSGTSGICSKAKKKSYGRVVII